MKTVKERLEGLHKKLDSMKIEERPMTSKDKEALGLDLVSNVSEPIIKAIVIEVEKARPNWNRKMIASAIKRFFHYHNKRDVALKSLIKKHSTKA